MLIECGVRGGLCLGSKETKDRGIDFFSSRARGVMVGVWQLGYLLPDHNGKRILLC